MKTEERLTDIAILAALETLAAAMPWDSVEIWIKRNPEGTYYYTTCVDANDQFGWQTVFGHGHTIDELVKDTIASAGNRRDPEEQRRKKIEELHEQIRKLEAVVVGSPPYVPNRELAEYNTARQPVDIASEVSNA